MAVEPNEVTHRSTRVMMNKNMVRRSVAEAYHYCKATTLHLQKESVLFDDSVTVSLEQIPWEFHIHFQTALI